MAVSNTSQSRDDSALPTCATWHHSVAAAEAVQENAAAISTDLQDSLTWWVTWSQCRCRFWNLSDSLGGRPYNMELIWEWV